MTTGMHTTRVVYCVECCESLGWLYEAAFEDDQKYKEGRCVLEESLLYNSVVNDYPSSPSEVGPRNPSGSSFTRGSNRDFEI